MKLVNDLLHRKKKEVEQNGINMVDLMMWLVIAALLLAAAIQGIGYYQQNAYVYQMKAAVDVATSRVTALASNDGNFTVDQVDTVVADMNANNTNGVVLSASAIDVTAAGAPGADPNGFQLASFATSTTVGAGQTYYIRASRTEVTGYDVIHTFGDTASKKAGTYLVNKGTTTPATPGGAPAPSPSATATTTASPSATTTATPTPTPTPTPTVTRPADVNATGVTIVANGYPASLWNDKSVAAGAGNASGYFGFSLSGVSNATAAANYTVVFSGGSNIGVGAYNPSYRTDNGYQWTTTVTPITGGFTVGTGYITATVTDKTTGNVSTKSWALTVTPQAGPIQSPDRPSDWNDKSTVDSVSNGQAVFGFNIPFAKSTDYTVAYSGGANIGAATTPAVGTQSDGNGGTDWYGVITPVSGGFTDGAGTITATVTNKLTGQVWTKSWTLTVTANAGPVQAGYYCANYWGNKTATVGSTSVATGSADAGFTIPYSVGSDFTVTYTSTGNVNEQLSAPQFWNPPGDYPNSCFYTQISAKTGGFTAGTSTITATVTSKATGRVYTKTWTFTVS